MTICVNHVQLFWFYRLFARGADTRYNTNFLVDQFLVKVINEWRLHRNLLVLPQINYFFVKNAIEKCSSFLSSIKHMWRNWLFVIIFGSSRTISKTSAVKRVDGISTIQSIFLQSDNWSANCKWPLFSLVSSFSNFSHRKWTCAFGITQNIRERRMRKQWKFGLNNERCSDLFTTTKCCEQGLLLVILFKSHWNIWIQLSHLYCSIMNENVSRITNFQFKYVAAAYSIPSIIMSFFFRFSTNVFGVAMVLAILLYGIKWEATYSCIWHIKLIIRSTF